MKKEGERELVVTRDRVKGKGGERRFNYITIVVGGGDNKNEN
jgi:hypothetical protein